MVAKVIASAETRETAIARLVAALRAYPILGVRTNIPFLIRLLEHPRFAAGDVDTGFLDREGASLAGNAAPMPVFIREALASLEGLAITADAPLAGATDTRREALDPWNRLRGWRT
jgi:acetyl/propionyl-CoA carboxylase alpha subunit